VKVVAVLPDRKKQTVKQFLERMPRRVKRAIRTACTDMYEGFIQAVKEVLGKAHVVIDRYRVAKLYRAGADRLRAQEMRRLKQELPKEDYAKLKGAMWPFRRRLTWKWKNRSCSRDCLLTRPPYKRMRIGSN
jgi:transposase